MADYIALAVALITAAGTAHTHAISGSTGAGTSHAHTNSRILATGTYTPGAHRGYGPVSNSVGGTIYLRTFASAADAANDVNATGEIAYIEWTEHTHAHADYSFTFGPTVVEAAHTHGFGTIAAANESTHAHNYDKTVTPTQGPS